MQGNSADQMKQEQMREMNEQISILKREMKNYPHLEIIEKIGQGSFGDIYKVWDNKRSKWVAMKFEKKDKKNKYSLIKKEAHIMQAVSGSRFFAALLDSRFSEQCQYKFLEMTFLGPNLESLKKRMEGKFSLRTVLLIANQMISGIETLHKKGIIHRDIKPENFVIGSEGMHHQIYVIDFGLSKYYLEENGKHIEEKQNKGLVGTARYTSVNSHLGLEQSRRDDLESIAYLLLYFVKGNLIWQNLNFKDKEERFKRIAELKQITKPEQMCKGLPQPFLDFITAVKNLSFVQEPEYERYRQFFSEYYQARFSTPEDKSCFDWCPRNCHIQNKALSRGVSTKTLSETHSLGTQNTKNTAKIVSEIKLEKQIGILTGNNGNVQVTNGQLKIIDNNSGQRENNGILQHDDINTKNNSKQLNGKEEIELNEVPTGRLTIIKDRDKIPSQTDTLNKMKFNGIEKQQQQQQQQQQQETIQKCVVQNDLLRMLDRHASQVVQEDKQKLNNTLVNTIEEEIDEEWHVSEFKANEKKRIPIFKTEDNYQKHQMQQQHSPFAKMAMSNNYFMHPSRIPLGKTNSFEIKAELDHSLHQGNSKQVNFQLVGSSSFARLSTPNLLSIQPFSIGNIPNKDSSQYVNDCSNEWSSLQDEKVAVQPVISFNSQHNHQQPF